MRAKVQSSIVCDGQSMHLRSLVPCHPWGAPMPVVKPVRRFNWWVTSFAQFAPNGKCVHCWRDGQLLQGCKTRSLLSRLDAIPRKAFIA